MQAKNYGACSSPNDMFKTSADQQRRKQLSQLAYFAGMLVVVALVVATVVVNSRYTVLEEITTKTARPVQMKQHAVHTQLDDEESPPAEGEGAGIFDPAQEEKLMEEVKSVFGWHLFFLSLVLVGTLALWIYVRFVRPQQWFRDFQKPFLGATSGFSTAPEGTVAHLDENDLPGSLTLVPGEAVFFNEEVALSFGGGFGSCSKMSVTNLRVIAQRSETLFCGTCSIGAYEDAWPIANVSKVRLATGEFYGYTVASLLHQIITCFIVAFLFDLASHFYASSVGLITASAPSIDNALVLQILASIANILVLLALVFAVAAAVLLIWPHTLLKVYLTRKMEDKSHMYPFSTPMESFTFQTSNAYKAYQAIFAAQTNAGTGKPLQGGAYNEIPEGVYTKATAKYVAASTV